jgi:hypothetical protein
MKAYSVFAGDTLIGHSDLEVGDPPMGVASGKFRPLPAYASVQAQCLAARESSQEHLCLSVRRPNDESVPSLGVAILDFSAELGADEIEVHAVGIPYPLYEELFPNHVSQYRNRTF